MNPNYIIQISKELNLREKQVIAVAVLLDEGSTVPFIARYRKENTGSLDEVAITAIRDRLVQLEELDKRRAAILESIEKQGKLTDDLKVKINAALTMAVLEDLYLPYKPKRRTRATIAKEKGLEPLALWLFDQQATTDPRQEAEQYVNEEKAVKTVDEALAGARDIIAEWISEDAVARAKLRELYLNEGCFESKVAKGKDVEGIKYKDYFDWTEPVAKAPSHRVLAMRRGEKEEFLILRITVNEDSAIKILGSLYIKSKTLLASQVALAIDDCFNRLLSLSMETEIRLITKQKADEEAIKVFADNLRQLLMASPLGEKNIIAIDPGFRTGCKVVCLNGQGKLLHNTTIYISQSDREAEESAQTIKKLVMLFNIEFIAIGNGTGSRETESFIRSLKLPKVNVMQVNESGASIYSASEVAREEFPTHDVTVRGSVSIGRRLQDPLAELVKLDPKSIGVGQYQHDVDQNKLKNSLDDVVISSVNQVGVELNTASKQLLMYVSGLGPALAKSIVDYRDQNGAFASRDDLKKIPRLSAKVFEQAAGFLRIRGAKNLLDASAVHPESYWVVDQIAKDSGVSINDIMTQEEVRKKINIQKYVSEKIGLPTLMDIMQELSKPGRDPRKQFEVIQFKEGVEKIEDLTLGMKLTGIVTNITNFGAFVDIGVHQDGLVHVSEIADKFVANPADVLKVAQKVQVTVMEIDIARRRISLSMRSNATPGVSAKSAPRTTSGYLQENKGTKTASSDKLSIGQGFSGEVKRKPLYGS